MKQPMWAQFCDSFAPVIDGVATIVEGYADALQQNGGCVVVVPKEPKYKDTKPYPIIRVPSLKTGKKIGYRLAAPVELRVLTKMKSMPLRIAHAHSPFSLSMIAEQVARAHGIPSVFTYHTKYALDFERTVPQAFREMVADFVVQRVRSFDEVWAVSRGAADDLRKLGYKGGVYIMKNGCSMSTQPVAPELIAAVKQKHALLDGVPVILFVGRLIWYKNVRLILETLLELQRDGVEFRMLFVGGGVDELDMRKVCRTMRLDDRVIFAGRISDRELLRAYYACADLFFFPSDFDTSGLVVQEAAALSCPSVVLRGSCVAEAVTDGVNGICVDDDAEQAAHAIKTILAAPDKLTDMGRRARDEVYLSWNDAMKQVLARYEKVIQHAERVKATEEML